MTTPRPKIYMTAGDDMCVRPAVDDGHVSSGLKTDQRGTGFPRAIGPSTDIDAFEGVDADSIFYNGFE